jgi:phosphoribosylformylglycinamidine cyclo-ligase
VVERARIVDGARIAEGDAVIGLPSSGIHSNGLSLARRALFEVLGLEIDDSPDELDGRNVGAELLVPTRIYARAMAALRDAVDVRGAAHITGGGLVDNPPRMLRRDDLGFELDTSTWEPQPIFDLIASAGVEVAEMRRTFNLGLGMLVVVAEAEVGAAIAAARGAGIDAARVGRVVARGDVPVVFR